MTAPHRVTIIAPNVEITNMHRIPSLLNALMKCVIIRCPECQSTNVRVGKENDDTLKCTCRAKGCGLRFTYSVLEEKVITFVDDNGKTVKVVDNGNSNKDNLPEL